MSSIVSYPGFLIPYTTIAVDYWPNKHNSLITHYFLTHAHADHTKNLDSEWRGNPIYCSSITKNLIIDLRNVAPELIIPLEMNQTHIMKLDENETFNVTLIDANHCPGAVMFLFEGYFGVILATGDFRYDPTMLIDSPLSNTEVDICFLDNTYFNPIFSHIPSRQDALQEIIAIIENKIFNNKNYLFKIEMKLLGKEELLVKLSKRFKTKIALEEKRYNRYINALNLKKKYFQMNFDENSLIYVEDDQPNLNHSLFSDKEIIYIQPSALNVDFNERANCLNAGDETTYSSDKQFYKVPYTDHSSYKEIKEFIKKLKPKRIVPIVRSKLARGIDTTDMTALNKYLNDKPVTNCIDKYRQLIESSTSVRSGARLYSYQLSQNNHSSMNISVNTAYRVIKIPQKLKKITSLKKQIDYDSPEKSQKENEYKVAKISVPLFEMKNNLNYQEKEAKEMNTTDNEPEKDDKKNEHNKKRDRSPSEESKTQIITSTPKKDLHEDKSPKRFRWINSHDNSYNAELIEQENTREKDIDLVSKNQDKFDQKDSQRSSNFGIKENGKPSGEDLVSHNHNEDETIMFVQLMKNCLKITDVDISKKNKFILDGLLNFND